MLRSLFAVIASVILGLAAAKFVEGAGAALIGESHEAFYQFLLTFSWFVGALIAALMALLLGRRWAPLGYLAAGTIFFSAFMTLLSAQLSWLLWPGAAIASAIGGYAALRLTNATNVFPERKIDGEIFGDN
jgi:sorbitol-specific phosphotransferase system component IIBC